MLTIPSEHLEKKWKKKSLKQISTLQIGEGTNTRHALPLKCCCTTEIWERVHMDFRSFYLIFFVFWSPAPEAPSAQILCDTKKWCCHSNLHDKFLCMKLKGGPHDITFLELWSTLRREMVLWRGLSSISSATEAELGEDVMFWAVENNLCALVLSSSLPYPEGCNWLIEVRGRGWQLQLDLTSLSGWSHYQHVPAFGRQFSRIFLSPSSLTRQCGQMELQTLPLQPCSGQHLCACSSSRWDSQENNSSALCLFFWASLSLAVRWGKDFQTCVSR